MDVSMPMGIFGFISNLIQKKLFLNTYRVSHGEYLKRSKLGKNFQNLGDLFEFDIHLEDIYFSNEVVPMSLLLLRNKSSEKINRIELLVEADTGYAKYQDFSTLVDIDNKPIFLQLSKIPLSKISLYKNTIRSNYQSITVKIISIENDGRKLDLASSRFYPSYTKFLNSKWDKKWDVTWNLDSIEDKKYELLSFIRYYLIGRKTYLPRNSPKQNFACIDILFRLLVRIPLYKFLSMKVTINTIFWVPIFLGLRKLKPKG